MDAITLQRIGLLHPAIRDEVKELIEKANNEISENLTVRIVQGLRTFEEQDALYAIGRTKLGKRVTNAKGGQSIHNFGMAIDFALLVNGNEISWDIKKDWTDSDTLSDWLEVVQVFLKAGYSWGGNWRTFKDYPHIERTFGLTWKELLKRYKEKDFIAGTNYVRIF